MALREQVIRTAKQWIQAHNDRSAAGREVVASLMAEQFVARTFPSSLRAPSRNREEYAAFQSWSLTLFDSYAATETDMIVDEAQHKVVYYLDAKGTAPAGEYQNQYIHKLILTEDGRLVKQFDAFMDSMPMVAWMEKARTSQNAKDASD
ncbi:hypothetical protein GGR55DRAFT_466971 [Xylaria sp. FL0064]|nr:hypothetical protein GGR55DRAFT_466971 [Xylaria sp. FL0064]